MKRSLKRILTIVLSIMIIMTYMVPGSVFADTALNLNETADAEVQEPDQANEELSEGTDDSDVVISDDEDPPVETKGEFIEEVPEAIEAEEPAEKVTEEPAEELPAAEETVTINDTAKAAAGDYSVLAFTSDTHNKSGNVAANRLGTWIEKVKAEYGKVDVMAFGGDMANASASESDFWTLTQADLDQLSQRDVTAVVTTGNHEYSPGNYSNGKNNTTKVYIENSEGIEGFNYRIYCLGSSAYTESSGGGSWWGGGGWNEYTSSQITKLGNYLGSVDSSKVIVVITHYPLHYTSSRTITGAGDVIDALNTAANSGKKIVYLWGHNHTDAPRTETNYDKVFKPGDTITYSSGQSKEINFYYGAAGCMSDSEYGTGSGSVKGKGLVLQINSENKLTFTYYNADLEDVTEGGAFTEADPVAVTGVTVTSSTAEVLERKTVQLTATVTPADATNKAVTWTSSNTSVATVDSKGLVKGVSEGNAIITATTVDGGFTASSTVDVLHNDDPSEEVTVEITPTTSGPEQSITINTGDTLIIDITNGSSSSTYNFTATVANTSVAKVQGDATVSIPAGGKGQIVVEGLTDGKTDITIQNNSSYGTQYARRGTIHLTVGDGSSTPVDPPTGDTVSITPSTDNPEQSIKINVGDTLTINTTNGSNYSEYNYTITTADSSIAQIQGNATINIASGATGQFTVKGLAEGTVDIVIQNDQSSAQYVRKGTIHLTVEEGGTPVDPVAVTGVTVSLKTATVEARKTVQLTANVTPADATNKKVTWSSSDTSVATVDENGKVKGVAEGTAIITATTADGGKTDTCTVTVTQSTVTEKRYVIVIDGFALSTDRSPNEAQGGSSNYKYTGLAGVAYTAGEDPDDNISWIIEETEGGYYIKDLEGRYLNATYTSGNNSGQGNLKVDNTPDVWTIEGTLEEWMVDGKMLRSINATNSTPDRPKFLGYEDSANLFTVRSEENADESTLIDPSVTIEERFVETSTLEDGKEYIIAVTKDSGSVYAIKNITGTDTGNTGSATLTVTPASGSDPAYIETDDADVVWKYQSSNQYMLASTGSNHYLGYESSTYKPRTSSSGRAITYSGGKLSIDTNHYLTCDNGTFGTSTSSSSGATVRLFVKTIEIITHEHVYGEPTWTWTGNVKTRAAVGATATFTCTECGEEIVKEAEVTSDIDSTGHTLYTATVTGPDGKEYTDQKYKAEDAQYTIKITANKENASVGDTVEFTITLLGPVDRFGSFQMTPVIPKGLTYKGFEIAEGLKDTLGFDNVDWEGTNLFFNGYGPYDYSSETDTVLATLSCTVNSEFSGSATLNINKDDFEVVSSKTWESMTEYYTIIPATIGAHTHTPGTAVRENEVQPTCTEAGGYDEVVYCTECGAEMSRTHVDVPALGHDWEFVDFTWTGSDEAGYTAAVANYECQNDKTHKQTITATVTSKTTAATCDTAGKTVYTATVAAADSLDKKEHSANKEVAIPALGHDWEFVDITWTGSDEAGYTAAVANYKCKNDASHTNTVTATVTSEITPATCEAAGKTVYTATVSAADSLDKKEHSATKEVAIPMLNHDWEFVDFTWTGSDEAGYTAAVANYKCKNDATHKNTVAATVTSETTAATCETEGQTVYTATVSAEASLDKQAHSDTKAVEIPATGHNYGQPAWTWAEDYSTATAKFTCANDATHFETVNATVAISQGTGEDIGKTVYTATAAFEGKTYTDIRKTVNQYTLTFFANEGDTEPFATITQDYGTAVNAPADPTKAFYTFSGWTSAVPATMPAENKTFTATWTAKDAYYLIGSMTEWKVVEANEFTSNPQNPAEYSVGATLAAGDEIKVVRAVAGEAVNTDYYPSNEHQGYNGWTDNYTVDQYHAGNVTVYFRPAGNFSDVLWQNFGGYFYIEGDHLITVNAIPSDKGTAYVTRDGSTAASATAPKGMPLTVRYTPIDNYQLDRIEILKDDGTAAEVTLDGASFNMPDHNVRVNVYFKVITWTFDKFEWSGSDEAGYTAAAKYNGDNGATKTVNATVTSETTAATCEEAGKTVYTATVSAEASPDGKAQRDTKTVEIPALGHDWEFVDITWTEADNGYTAVANYKCKNDAAHTNKVTATVTSQTTAATCETAGKTVYTATVSATASLDKKEHSASKEVAIPALGHDWEFVDITWTEADNGYTAVANYKCKNDAAHTNKVAATVTSQTTAATCEEAGKTVYTATVSATASLDKQAHSDTKTVLIPALGHDWEFVDITWTEADNGYTAVANYKCRNDATHTNTVAATVTSETTAATCETAGKTVYTATVAAADSLDKKEHSATKEVAIPALGHDWEFVDITWTEADNGYTAAANYKCRNDAAHTNTVAATVTSETTAATCETAGKTVYTATVSAEASPDGKAQTDTKTVVISALGHDWEFVDITWTGSDETGYTAAVANYKCRNDATHTNTVTATVTSETTAATCETAGKTVYTATVVAAASLDKKEHSMTKEVAIAALGHDWNTPLFVWSEDHTSVTAIFICKNNPAHIEKVTASGDAITSKVTTEPTEEKPGVMTYTASVTGPDGKIYTTSDTEEIPALENKEVVRIYGQTRYETAIKVADELKAKLGVSEFSTIILAYGSNYADALAGSYLSCILDAPIILVDARQDHIDQAQAYIRKNLKNGGQIYILGGTGVVPESAVAGLSGYKIDRLGGATRYETNIEILKEAAKFSNDNSEILVCSGQNFPDSLSAAATGKPILLVKNALQDGQKTYLKSLGGSMTFTVIGGTGAVSDSVKNELNAYGKTDRVWGLTRYETSTAVAKKYFKNPEQGVIAYGVNFPDGLCGGVLAYNMDAPLLLAANGKTDAAVKYAGESGTTLGAVLGGPTLVSDASVRAILHMDKDSEIIVR